MYKNESISEKAWKLRESGKPIPAIALWKQVINKQKGQGNWEEVMNTLIDISIALKIVGKQTQNSSYFDSALSTLEHIKHIATYHNIPLRKDFNYHLGEILVAAGRYQEAIDILKKYLKTAGLSLEQKANIQSHIGFAKARLGQKDGIKILEQAIKVLEHPTTGFVHQEVDVIAIWRTGARLKLAQVLEDRQKAIELVNKTLKEAQKNGLGARIKEAKLLLADMDIN
ncbi:MAG: hypothetical protein M1142_02315 [Patescibacteria group bacterium]|nr:hypothetical protein [Patescibacteria group bacterium]